jgi:hypothetical protein
MQSELDKMLKEKWNKLDELCFILVDNDCDESDAQQQSSVAPKQFNYKVDLKKAGTNLTSDQRT